MSNKSGGYTHGMLTLLVPEKLAQTITSNARQRGLPVGELMLKVLSMAADIDFVDIVLEDEDRAA